MRLIAGPCLIESREHCLRMASALAAKTQDLPVEFIFKASFRKANRTSVDSPRGMFVWGGAAIFEEIEEDLGIQAITDVHSIEDCYTDYPLCLQIPALLSRQTDLIEFAAAHCKTLNIKKGQFTAPQDMKYAVEKAKRANPECHVMVTERGYSFGYNNLVVDFRSIPIMKATSGADEVLFDCTHSVQLPSSGPNNGTSGGQREYIEGLARASIVNGSDGLFCEVHDDPANAQSDGPCQIPLHLFSDFLKRILDLYAWQQATPLSSFPLA